MSLETAVYVADLVSSNPVGGADVKAQGDDHLRMIKAVLQNTFPGLAGRINRVVSKTGAFTAGLSDNSSIISTSGTWNLSVTSPNTLGNGWMLIVFNNGAGTITIVPSAGTVNGSVDLQIATGQVAVLYCDGTNFLAVKSYISAGTMSTQNANAVAITGGSISGITDLAIADGGTGASSASAARINLGAQVAHAKLTALSGLVGGANFLPYFSSTDSMLQTAISAFIRTLLNNADAATARTTLGAQAAHSKLSNFANLSGGVDRLGYFNGTDTLTQTVLTAFARSILDDIDASAVRTTLGLGAAALVAIPISLANGGTGATTALAARQALQLDTAGGELTGNYPNPGINTNYQKQIQHDATPAQVGYGGELTAKSFTLPANTLVAGRKLRVRIVLDNGHGVAASATIRVRLNGVQLYSYVASGGSGDGNVKWHYLDVQILHYTTNQVLVFPTGQQSFEIGVSSGVISGLNDAANQTFAITAQLAFPDGAPFTTVREYWVELE